MDTVLIIEDDSNLREGLELYFELEGYRTWSTSNGLAGIESARKNHPDVILTNFQMPGASGLDVLRAVRSDADLASTPVVFLTANHHRSVRERALLQGANVFVKKPFKTEELSRIVAELISESRHHEVT